MILKSFKIPIYGGVCDVILDKDLSYVQKKYKTIPLSGYGAVTIKDESKYRKYILAFEGKDTSLIVHEVVHLVNYIFSDCGIKLDIENDESQAYITAWLFEKVNKIVNT